LTFVSIFDLHDGAAHHDDGSREGRNRMRHEAWLAALPCPVLRLDGGLPTDVLVDAVLASWTQGA
jgi:hypothetical protein